MGPCGCTWVRFSTQERVVFGGNVYFMQGASLGASLATSLGASRGASQCASLGASRRVLWVLMMIYLYVSIPLMTQTVYRNMLRTTNPHPATFGTRFGTGCLAGRLAGRFAGRIAGRLT